MASSIVRARGQSAKVSLGDRLRTIRESKGITLDELSNRTGLTKSFLSQVERDKSNPSITSLRQIVIQLNIPMASLFLESGPSNIVVRRDKRKKFRLPDSALDFEMLVPDLNRKLEVVRVIAPRGGSSEFMAHEGEECGYVVNGKIKLTVGSETYVLESGDSACYPSTIPHTWVNIADGETELIWIITPPSF